MIFYDFFRHLYCSFTLFSYFSVLFSCYLYLFPMFCYIPIQINFFYLFGSASLWFLFILFQIFSGYTLVLGSSRNFNFVETDNGASFSWIPFFFTLCMYYFIKNLFEIDCSFYVFIYFWLFWRQDSLCSFDCPGTHYVDQFDLEPQRSTCFCNTSTRTRPKGVRRGRKESGENV